MLRGAKMFRIYGPLHDGNVANSAHFPVAKAHVIVTI